MNKRLNNMKLI